MDLPATVREYIKGLLDEAQALSSVSPLDFYSDVDNKECVSRVFVSVTSLSFDQAWRLLQQQQKSDAKEQAYSARTAKPESKTGLELNNLEVLLQRKSDGLPIQRSLVLGWGGSGKSIVCRKILFDWKGSNGEVSFKHYLAVVYISGRDTARVITTSERVFLGIDQSLSDEESNEVVSFLAKNSKKLLFVFDGGDEVGQGGLHQNGTIFNDLLCRRGKFGRASLIVTSRPCGGMFKALTMCSFDRHFSLIGLKKKRLQELACRRLGSEEEAMEFQRQLTSPAKAQVKAAVQETPLFAAMLIRLFSEDKAMPSSITQLYSQMLEKILLRNAQRILDRHEYTQEGSRRNDQGNELSTRCRILGQSVISSNRTP